MLPPSPREFKDIYVVFELMESDLHQVIKANDDLTPEHFQFFLYQLLRALKYIHTANVFHRDLKPKNILANADCKLKICDFGLARVTCDGASSALFWTDYVATRWYRAPELCGSFFSKYTTAVDIWSIGCIFAEILTGKPLFPGRNVVHQLDLITDMLGTPPPEVIGRICNEKARRYLSSMRKKKAVDFHQKFPHVDPLAICLLQRLLAFDAKDRPTAEEALADPYFRGLAKVEREPSSQPASKTEFEFERKRLTKDDVRELIYREILEYHPEMLKQHLSGRGHSKFMYPSAVDQLKRQFDYLQEQSKDTVKVPIERKPTSLPRERISIIKEETNTHIKGKDEGAHRFTDQNTQVRARLAPHKSVQGEPLKPTKMLVPNVLAKDDVQQDISNVRRLVKSASAGLSQQTGSLQAPTRPHALSKSDQDKREEDTVKESHPSQSRTKAMGITVAKMVAAFSSGVVHS